MGASSGIGRVTAVLLASSGAKVVAAARRQAEGEETVRQARAAGGEAVFVPTDIEEDIASSSLSLCAAILAELDALGAGRRVTLAGKAE